MKKLLREPLLHFVLLGAALFAVFGMMKQRGGVEPGNIIITQGRIEHLATGFARTRQRPPTAEELEALIRDAVREEVYVREAMAMGLDRDDTVIRRRLRQKLEFVSEDIAALAEPSDADLRAFLQSHPDKFRDEPRFTFSHVYLNPQRHRDRLARDATDLLARLKRAGAKADVTALGDPFLLAHHFDAAPGSEIAKQFGEKFAGALKDLGPGEWRGPVQSGYGVHLVRVAEVVPGRVPPLEEIRGTVSREWSNLQRQKANEDFFQALLGRYSVTIERPQAADAGSKLTAAAR